MGTVFEEMCRYYTLKQGIQGGWLVYYFSGNQVGVENELIRLEAKDFTQLI